MEGEIHFKEIPTVGKIMKMMSSSQTASEAYERFIGHAPSVDFEEVPCDTVLWELLIRVSRRIQKKMIEKAREPIKDIDKIVDLVSQAQRIIVIIGAGASIGPDFRSPGGLYDTIAKEEGLEDPYQVFDIDYFQEDPSLFWKYAHMIFPDKNPRHSATHYFIKHIQERGKLQRLYSQNVDTLECDMPKDLFRCVHGSWRDSKCLKCGKVFDIEEMRPYVETKTVPTCPCGGQIKPGIVFFGQKTNIEDEDITSDAEVGDLLIVVGTSLRVAPISMLPDFMGHIPSILINREPVTCNFSAELLGDCSNVVEFIEKKLGWNDSEKEEETKFTFHEPNKFFFQDPDGRVSSVEETGVFSFLVTPTDPNPKDLE